MSRFVAKYAKYRHGVRTGRFMVLADGQRQELSKDLIAKFERGLLTPEEENVGIASLSHTGLPHDRDTEEHVSPRSRISGFDSVRAQEYNGWTDDERELVETTLRKSDLYGDEFIELTPAEARRPWPVYDEMQDVESILDILRLTGVPVRDVIAYERQNQNRYAVLEALEDYDAKEEEDEVVLIQA